MFKELYQRYIPSVEETMRDVVGAIANHPDEFRTTIAYPLGWEEADGSPYTGRTGKRIRPILLLACVTAAGGNWQKALPAAAAVEILHNFSLVHDDIQDASSTRHHRPTVWKIWGEPLAINTGDAMFALAYRAMQSLAAQEIATETVLTALDIYTNTVLELTRGQYLDMHFETRDNVTVEDYLSMIQGKTAALLAGSAQIAATVAGQPAKIAQHYADFGLNIGLAFQIRDDILGIWGDASETGKSNATDILSRKKSVPVLYGLQRSADLRTLYAQPEGFTQADVVQIIGLLEETGAKDATVAHEQHYYGLASAALDAANPTVTGRAELEQLVDGLFQRSY